VVVQEQGDTMGTVTAVLLGAVTLAVGASLVEAGLRAWRAAARRRRRERKARGSQSDTTPPMSPPPLRVDTRMHQARTHAACRPVRPCCARFRPTALRLRCICAKPSLVTAEI
jgi:hypothetical protein